MKAPDHGDKLIVQTSDSCAYLRAWAFGGARCWTVNLYERGEEGELCWKRSYTAGNEAKVVAWGKKMCGSAAYGA